MSFLRRARGVAQAPKRQDAAAGMLAKLCSAAGHVCPACPVGISKKDSQVQFYLFARHAVHSLALFYGIYNLLLAAAACRPRHMKEIPLFVVGVSAV